MTLFGDDHAFVRYDSNSLRQRACPGGSAGRHVADFFEHDVGRKNVRARLAGPGEGGDFTRTFARRVQHRRQYRQGGGSIAHAAFMCISSRRYAGDVADPSVRRFVALRPASSIRNAQ